MGNVSNAAFAPDYRCRPSLRAWLRWPIRCLRLYVKGWNA